MNSRPWRIAAFGFMICFALTALEQAAWAAACALTAEDFAALQLSNSGLASQSQIDAKPPNQQAMLCATRLHWNRVASGTSVDSDLDEISPHYLSPLERGVYGKLTDAKAQAILSHMSDAEWRQLKQKTLGELKK
jgi:hypothetical protein